MLFMEERAGGWKFITAASLPADVTGRTFLAVTNKAASKIHVCDSAPETPIDGDVWFHVVNPDSGTAMSDGSVPIKCWGAYQYDSVMTAWTLLTAYYAYLGAWWALPGLPPVGTTLENCTWAQIDRIGKIGKGADYFTVGSTKTVTLTTGEAITLVLVGMNHDPIADGSRSAPFSFQMQDCLQATGQLEATVSNTNGWNGCAMRNTCNTTLFGVMPDALKTVIKQVQKKASAGNQSASIVTSLDKIWLAAEVELYGTCPASKAGEGSQYAYYTNSGVRLKKVSGVVATWFTRSPAGCDSASFCVI
ncbi:MAG: DUF6273 domain-containing protein, partial [Clostridia bacterium]